MRTGEMGTESVDKIDSNKEKLLKLVHYTSLNKQTELKWENREKHETIQREREKW